MTVPDDWTEFTPPDVLQEAHDQWPTFDLEFAVEADDSGREQCTVFPRETPDEDVLTTWIAAEEGSYMNLWEVR
ncbi:MAG: hypothetical protein ABEJ28_01685 [Salinigranum sp.]